MSVQDEQGSEASAAVEGLQNTIESLVSEIEGALADDDSEAG